MISKIKQEMTEMIIQTMAQISRELVNQLWWYHQTINPRSSLLCLLTCVLKSCGKLLKSLYSTFRLLFFSSGKFYILSHME